MPELWEGESPNLFLIKRRYYEAKLDRWSNDRVDRLAKLLNCTPRELCGLAGVFDKKRVDRWRQDNKYPMEIALHFAHWESFIVAYKFRKAQPPTPDSEMIAKLSSAL